jgi:hypothetical protein
MLFIAGVLISTHPIELVLVKIDLVLFEEYLFEAYLGKCTVTRRE